MRKFCSNLNGWRGAVLILYMSFVMFSWLIVHADFNGPYVQKKFYILSALEVMLAMSICICPKLLKSAEKLKINPELKNFTYKEKKDFFVCTLLIVFLIFWIRYLITYPGNFPPDNINQLSQAAFNKFNDHHPVFHTLFAFWLPFKLTFEWSGSIVCFQIILFSFSLAYMALTLFEYTGYFYTNFFMVFTLLNPLTLSYAVTPLKDTSFAIASIFLMTFALRICFTNGKWLESNKNLIFFVIVLTFGTLFRHNALLFTFPLLFSVSLYVNKKRAFVMLICVLSLIYCIRSPFYKWLEVEMSHNIAMHNASIILPGVLSKEPVKIIPSNRQIESLGLPMSIIGNAVKEADDKLDSDVLQFAYSVASRDVWKKHYNKHIGFNSVKYAKNNSETLSNWYAIERAGWKKVLLLTAKCFRDAPLASFRGMFAVIDIVYGRSFSAPYFINPTTTPDLGYALSVKEIGLTLLRPIFLSIGLIDFVILIFILAKLKFNRLSDWKRFFLVIPVFTYNFGTMFFLTDREIRFFYYTYTILPLVLLILLRNSKEDNLSPLS